MTWSDASIVGPGTIITASVWNSYLGANSSTQFLINNYSGIYYTSFIGVNGVANAVDTFMNLTASTTTYTIPSSWHQGLYMIYAAVFPNTSENATGRRRVSIFVNGSRIKTETVNAISLLTSGFYPVTHIQQMSPGNTVRVAFLQNSSTSFLYRTIMDVRKISV